MTTPSALQDYYAARAPDYDAVYARPERQEELRSIERWLSDAFRQSSLIEIACGTGYWSRLLSQVVREMLAVDSSPEVLSIAKDRIDLATTRLALGDAYRLPAAPARFDAAFAGFWISHVPRSRLRHFFSELHRTVAPGSRVVLLDNRFVQGHSTPICETDSEGNTYQVRELRNGSSHRVLKNFPSEPALRELLEGSSRDVRFERWHYYWAIDYRTADGRL